MGQPAPLVLVLNAWFVVSVGVVQSRLDRYPGVPLHRPGEALQTIPAAGLRDGHDSLIVQAPIDPV